MFVLNKTMHRWFSQADDAHIIDRAKTRIMLG
jgi:hypothetical protein